MAQHADLVALVRWRYDSAGIVGTGVEVGSAGEAVVCLNGEPAARYYVGKCAGPSWKEGVIRRMDGDIARLRRDAVLLQVTRAWCAARGLVVDRVRFGEEFLYIALASGAVAVFEMLELDCACPEAALLKLLEARWRSARPLPNE